MPLDMDRHNVPGATVEDAAHAHLADRESGERFGVEFISHWFERRGLRFPAQHR